MQKPWDRWAEGSMRFALGGGWGLVCDRGSGKEQARQGTNWSKWKGELRGGCQWDGGDEMWRSLAT